MDAVSRETTRALAKAVFKPDWKPTAPASVEEITATITELEAALPLKRSEPGLDGAASRMIEDSLRPIGAKIDPRISTEQAEAWRKALLLALSDLPAPVVMRAVRDAVHRPYQFLNEVEQAVREIAAELMENRRLALVRLKRWRDELERAKIPQPRLEPPPEAPQTQQDVDELNAIMRSAGIKSRWEFVDGKAIYIPPPQGRKEEERRRSIDRNATD